jgi:hypothetical protein
VPATRRNHRIVPKEQQQRPHRLAAIGDTYGASETVAEELGARPIAPADGYCLQHHGGPQPSTAGAWLRLPKQLTLCGKAHKSQPTIPAASQQQFAHRCVCAMMETLDAGNRQRSVVCPSRCTCAPANRPASVGLPPMNHQEPERVKQEMDYQRKHPSAAMPSPLHPFAGPSRLHSNHQSPPASALPASLGGLLSPPESRRTSGDDKDVPRSAARQSLPSILEALGNEQPLSYPPPVPPPSVLTSAPQHYHGPSAATSPSDQRSRPFSTDPHGSQGPSNPFSHPRSPYLGSATPQAPPPPPPPHVQADPLPRPAFADPRPPYSTPQHNSKLPTLHPLKTTQTPPPNAARPSAPYSYPPPSTNFEAPGPPPAAAMNQYSYPQYPPNYPLSAPAPSASNSAYPPSNSTYSAPPRYPPPSSWRDNPELARLEEKKIGRSSLAPYGESVKRHLDSFDLEASLNEVRAHLFCACRILLMWTGG